MRKLELKDIQSYPIGENGIKCHSSGEFTDEEPTVLTINGYSINYHGVWVDLKEGNDPLCVLLEDIFPILRPISDLANPITVEGYNEGKEFVPLQKIAEIYGCLYHGGLVGDLWGYDVHICDDCQDYYFGWNDDWFYYFDVNGECYENQVSTGDPLPFKLEIIDLLNQWHFDYRGLIEERLAVDINTLQK